MVRMVHHVFAEVALPAVGAAVGVDALNVAILAAGDIFRRAHRNIVGAAERVVVATGIDHGRLSPLETTCEQGGEEQERKVRSREVRSHAQIPSVSPSSSLRACPANPPKTRQLLDRRRNKGFSPSLRGALATKQSICVVRWIASRSLSSGAHSRDPLARNDGTRYHTLPF